MKKEKNELKNIKFSKLYIMFGLFIFVLIIYRIGVLSTSKKVENVDIQHLASQRTTRVETLYSKRGTIYDNNKNALAQNISSYTLIAYLSKNRTTDDSNPKHVVDIDYTSEKLSEVLDIPKDTIYYYLSNGQEKGLYQVELGAKAKNLTELKKDEIVALKLPGIDFIETQQRYYPYGTFASYIIGYAKKKEVKNDSGEKVEDLVGEMGIESYYNKELTGTNGYTLYQKDRNGYKIAGTQEVTVDAIDGNDIYLTINSNIQLFVEDAINALQDKCTMDWASLILADATTGAILASGTYPTFDPNKKNIESYLNLNTSVPFEPGSTMKIFSYMAAMENGVYNGSDTYKSGIFTARDGTEIGDWNRQGWGYITYDAGFALSSNTAVMNLIDKYMSAEQLRDYYKKLGFGSKTGIELPNESSGKLSFKYQTEILNAGFGQGITTTPIQNIKALTSISNDGILLQPYLVEKIVNHDTGEVIYQGGRKELGRVASIKTTNKIKELMRSVIAGNSKTSTGYYYYMDGYDFIAKTGTAQVADSKGYSNNIVIRGLAGMFPGDDPKVLLYMAIKNPTCSNKDVSEFIQSIIKNTSKYLEIYDETKEQTKKLETITVESYIDKDVKSVESTLSALSIKTVIIGNGNKIVSQVPKYGEVINKIDRVFLLTNGNEIKMPDLVGYSAKDFYSFTSLTGLKYKTSGIGYVTSQSIPIDTVLKETDEVEVTFEAKY
ncbi:MAG: penicillin-binding protein [Bacilli bacterium]|nr:penicillin-binding protein [Bacilli bacterium]